VGVVIPTGGGLAVEVAAVSLTARRSQRPPRQPARPRKPHRPDSATTARTLTAGVTRIAGAAGFLAGLSCVHGQPLRDSQRWLLKASDPLDQLKSALQCLLSLSERLEHGVRLRREYPTGGPELLVRGEFEEFGTHLAS
jgi:hypothetical protein